MINIKSTINDAVQWRIVKLGFKQNKGETESFYSESKPLIQSFGNDTMSHFGSSKPIKLKSNQKFMRCRMPLNTNFGGPLYICRWWAQLKYLFEVTTMDAGWNYRYYYHGTKKSIVSAKSISWNALVFHELNTDECIDGREKGASTYRINVRFFFQWM